MTVPALPVIAWAVSLAVTAAEPASWTAGVVLLSALICAVTATRGGRLAAPAVTAAVVLALAGVLALSGQLQHTLRWPEALEDGDRVVAIVEVTAPPVLTERFGMPASSRTAGVLVAVSPLADPERTVAVRAPVLVFDAPAASDVDGADRAIGSVLSLEATLVRAETTDDVAWTLVSVTAEREVSEPSAIVAAADRLRRGFSAWSSQLPGDGGALLPGLAIGDTSAVDEPLRDAMRQSSLSHLTAVSGANCALVVAGAVAVLALLGAGLRLRIVGGGIALGAFVVLVTPQPSVLRAAVMALAVLAAVATGRRRGGLHALGLAVVLLLVFDPWLSRNAGFALSAAATAGLLTLAGPMTRGLERIMPRAMALAIAIPAAAQVACQPILILLRPDIPLLSVPANLLAGPAAPLATVLGLLACLLLPVVPWLGGFLGTIGWAPSAWIAAVARFFAAVPAALPWLPGVLGAALATVAVLLICTGVLRRRLMPALLGAALVMAVVAALVGARWGRDASVPRDWDLAACDVGQGAATLINGADGLHALVDTGDDPDLLDACLDLMGVDRIALLVLTHFDRDHIGAAPHLIGRVDRLMVGPSDGAEADALIADLAAGGAQVFHAADGDRGALGRVTWSVLWPRSGVEPGNDASVVLDVRAPGLSALLLGDMGAQAQDRLLRQGEIRPVDVVGVAHHGSADQSPRLYGTIGADLALVSVGADNTYGHPAPSLIDMLASLGDQIERTDLVGTIAVSAGRDGGHTMVWSERDPGVGAAG
jgi:competence protein ComEC